MTRNFGIISRSTRGSHAHNIDYRAPHAQSPGNDCNLNFNSSAVGKPSRPRSDLAPPDDWRSFIPMPSGSILERGDIAQAAIDVFATGFGIFFLCLMAAAVGAALWILFWF